MEQIRVDSTPPSGTFWLGEFQAELSQPPSQANGKRRLELLAQLSDSGDPAAAPAFVQALDLPDLAREAVAALVKLKAEAFNPLQPLLFGADARRATLAALVLAEIGEPIKDSLKEAIRQANYEMPAVAGAVLPRVEWPLLKEAMSAVRLERPYVEKQYRDHRAEAFFRRRLEDAQAAVEQIGAPLVALIAASQQENETLRVATQRVLKELGWDENRRAGAYQKAKRKVPNSAALLPRQKHARAWWTVGIVLVIVLLFCLPVTLALLGN